MLKGQKTKYEICYGAQQMEGRKKASNYSPHRKLLSNSIDNKNFSV